MNEFQPSEKAAATAGLSRLSRRWLIILLAVTAIISAGVGLVAGRIFDQSEIIHPENSMAEVPVYASVENRIVDDRLTFAGVVKVAPIVPILIDLEGQEPIVVRQTIRAGATLKWGDLVGVVSGKPYFVLPGPLPLYRDLSPGDEGDDVLALQRALIQMGYITHETGHMDSATMNAAASFFASEGFTLRSGQVPAKTGQEPELGATPERAALDDADHPAPSIPFKQLLTLPVASVTVSSALGIGQKVTDQTPLATFQAEDNYVEFVAEIQQAETLEPGQEVTVRVSEKQLAGRITGVGPFTDAGNGQRAGHPVTVEPTNKADLALLTPNLSITVAGKGSAAQALAVPLSGIRQDAGGTYVLKTAGGDATSKAPPTRVPVTVLRSGGGFAAVSGDLSQGDEVQIS
ncbi:efflux RND transporter periplasmic adaptor subunit [Paenarthrobacter sp. CAP02]|uniref:efflux RND transporter periplasmic adaptor subunit n=1 Tax=Paenarthrobacter sp. CAP02 TaxID=3158144 RepID=UPI0032DB436B